MPAPLWSPGTLLSPSAGSTCAWRQAWWAWTTGEALLMPEHNFGLVTAAWQLVWAARVSHGGARPWALSIPHQVSSGTGLFWVGALRLQLQVALLKGHAGRAGASGSGC